MARHFSNWLDAYLEYTKYSEAPDQFHLWTGIGTLAGALRRKAYLNMGYFKWHTNFFLTFVAPPGIVSKSTTADIGIKLLRQVEGMKIGPSSATWQSLIPGLANNAEEYPLTPGKMTPDTEFEIMSCMTVVARELGTFLDPHDSKSIDVLVDLWDCPEGAWEKTTKLEGVETVINPWFQLIGCTTPGWISENMSTYFIEGGFASRTLFIFSDKKRQLVAYPGSHIPAGHIALADKLVADLQHISKIQGAFKLTPAAEAWGTQWYEDHFTKNSHLQNDSRFAGYFARKQTHIHKTAMIRSVALRDNMLILPDDLQWAERAVTALEPGMRQVFGEINQEEIVKVQNTLLSILRQEPEGKLRKENLFKHMMCQIGYATFEEALNGLYGSGLAIMETNGPHTSIALTEAVEARPVVHQPPMLRVISGD